jgi:hypothetical protein
MAKVIETGKEAPRRRPPARTPEARENQMVALAMDLVEERLRNKTATSQETTHFLKIATKKYQYENEILEKQKELMMAKTEALQSQKRSEELFKDAN